MSIGNATCQLIGNITRKEMKDVNGKKLLNLGIAVGRRTPHGDEKEETSFFDVDFWDKQAEILDQYTEIGHVIAIDCEPRQDRWEDKDGKKQSRIRFVGRNFTFLPNQKKSESSEPTRKSSQSGKAYKSARGRVNNGYSEDNENDVPF